MSLSSHPHVHVHVSVSPRLALPFYFTHFLPHSFHFFPHLKFVDYNLLRTPHKESMDLSDEFLLSTVDILDTSSLTHALKFIMSYHFERSSQPAASRYQQVELTHAERVNLGNALRSDSWNVSVEIPGLRRVVRLHDHVPVTDGGVISRLPGCDGQAADAVSA